MKPRFVFLAFLLLVCLVPALWTLGAALGIGVLPTVEHFVEVGVTEPQFGVELGNSTLIAVLVTASVLLISFPAAYALARSRFRGRRILIQTLLVLACLPVLTYLIPLRELLRNLHLYDQPISVLAAETAMEAPLAVYVLVSILRQQPTDPEEAARLDGARLPGILLRIALPGVLPAVAAVAILLFVLSWNQLPVPLLLHPRLKTIPTGMLDFFTFERDMDWPSAAAALIASLLPVAAFVALFSRVLEHFTLAAAPSDS